MFDEEVLELHELFDGLVENNQNTSMEIEKIKREPNGSKVVPEMVSWFGITTKTALSLTTPS